MRGENLTGAAQGLGSLGEDPLAKQTGQCLAGREMTVEEMLNARIEHHNRQIAKLMEMRDSTPHNVLSQPISRFERLSGALFGNRATAAIWD